MRIGVVPENPLEWLLLRLNLIPTPLMDTHLAFLVARLVMVATRVGIFEALKEGPRQADALAATCNTHPRGTEKLLDALVSLRYLRPDQTGYRLAPVARKWLLRDSPHTIYSKMLFHFAEWDITRHLDDYVTRGQSQDLHGTADAETWAIYQRAMKDIARSRAPEVARTMPAPHTPKRLLDIGGSHGLYAVELCRKYSGLEAVILDLPNAIEYAAPLLAEEKMGSRVVHRAGDALKDDFGESAWDIVFISSLVHHFDEVTNRELTARVARSLKPGGVFVIQEMIRTPTRFEADKPKRRVAALLDLYFAATSASGTWSVETMNEWQKAAGLVPRQPLWSRSLPGIALVSAFKPA
jgi:SAM-dependent methyltransferase